MREISFNRAIVEATREEMLRDETVFVMGEDVEAGLTGKTGGLIDEFGPERVRDTAIAEVGIVGTAIGAAAAGMRPVAELMFWVHSYMAMDQIINQAAKMRHMFGGQGKLPLVIRGSAVTGASAQHSDSVHAMFMHVPGLKIIAPSTPYDAKGLLKSAIRDDNPVLCFEAGNLGGLRGPVPEEEYTVPLGVADVKREGSDVTLVAISGMVPRALAAAEALAEDGISVEVVDPRSLAPLDTDTILASVKKTGRLVVADEAQPTCGASAEIAALVAEDDDTFECLKAPVQRVARKPVPVPFSPPMLRFMTPAKDTIVSAIRKVVDQTKVTA
jgi:pyruvate dehydrogenase E1 component beta subunit|tara:strand:- start:3561 stop:4547 length:987 start_codon:yes stop_codon:yes gene_type:complete